MLLWDFARALEFSWYFGHLSPHLLSSGTWLVFIYSKFSFFKKKHFSIFLNNADRGLVVCCIIQGLHCLLSVSCLCFAIYLSGICYIWIGKWWTQDWGNLSNASNEMSKVEFCGRNCSCELKTGCHRSSKKDSILKKTNSLRWAYNL